MPRCQYMRLLDKLAAGLMIAEYYGKYFRV
jgi:hypothetical protein